MQVNYWGSVYCAFYALPFLKESKGQIVNVLSGAGITPAPKSAGYAASKHAVAGFFNSIRIEVAMHGISVTMVYPDWVETGITSRAIGPDGKLLGKVGKQEIGAMPVDRCASMIIKAIRNRQRDLFMTPRIKIAAWCRHILPGAIDYFAAGAFK